jgi:serine/threonine protein kinase
MPLADQATTPVMLTAPGTVLGTPYYMAPELYGGAAADARCDQFSFCVALFTALHGERPFDGDTFASLAALMYLHAARLAARVDDDGELCALVDQDRSRWDAGLAAAGLVLLEASAAGTELTAYHVVVTTSPSLTARLVLVHGA